jgi:hypothetical protein
MMSAVRGLEQPHPDIELQCRIGVSTGLVVVGDLVGAGAAQEQAVVGETPNLAARLQAIAEPNGLVIGPTTRRLIGDLFECRALGAVELKGFAEPIGAWQVVGPSTVESRFEALRSGGLTPLVGREEEIELLLRRWRQAQEGEGRVVLLSGEPGIGKSRIARALQERLAGGPHAHLLYFCSISARRVIRAALSIPSSASSSVRPASSGMTPLISSSTSWRRCSPSRARLSRMTRLFSPRCCRCRPGTGTLLCRSWPPRSERRNPSRPCSHGSTD